MEALSGKKNAHAPSEVIGRSYEVAGGPFKFVTMNDDECSQVGWINVTRARQSFLSLLRICAMSLVRMGGGTP